jgi:hypothetical protein
LDPRRRPASNRVRIDGDWDAQTIRPEGDIGGHAVRCGSIIGGDAGAEWIGFGVERSAAGGFAGIDARFAGRRAAVGTSELAGLPWPAIDLATLKAATAANGKCLKACHAGSPALGGRRKRR